MARAKFAMIKGPEWMWGGNLKGFFKAAKLVVRSRTGQLHGIQPEEQYVARRRPLLVEDLLVIAPNGQGATGRSALTKLVDEEIESGVHLKRERLDYPKPEPTGNPLLDLVVQAQVDLYLCDAEDLAKNTRHVLDTFRMFVFTDEDVAVFPQSSVHAVRRSSALVHRVKLSSVLIRAAVDPSLAAGDPTSILAEHAAGRSAFGSSESLQQGIYVFDVYLAPLESALSPAVWVFAARRVHGTVLVSLGRPVSGLLPYARELMQTLHHPAGIPNSRGTYEEFSDPRAAELAIGWWAEHLDHLFGVLTDPGTFADPDGQFDPIASMQALLSVEQLFQRVGSVQIAYRDINARRVSFFSAMDTYYSLCGGIPMVRLFTHSYALKTLERLEAKIHPGAHDILLVAARRGVEALRELQDGFFLVEADDKVNIGDNKAAVTREVAAGHYLAVLRDATHGFSTTDTKQKQKVARLLVAHTGNVSHDIGFLAWLYLLDLLAAPDRLRKILGGPQWASAPANSR